MNGPSKKRPHAARRPSSHECELSLPSELAERLNEQVNTFGDCQASSINDPKYSITRLVLRRFEAGMRHQHPSAKTICRHARRQERVSRVLRGYADDVGHLVLDTRPPDESGIEPMPFNSTVANRTVVEARNIQGVAGRCFQLQQTVPQVPRPCEGLESGTAKTDEGVIAREASSNHAVE